MKTVENKKLIINNMLEHCLDYFKLVKVLVVNWRKKMRRIVILLRLVKRGLEMLIKRIMSWVILSRIWEVWVDHIYFLRK
jgi:hypothetical protein